MSAADAKPWRADRARERVKRHRIGTESLQTGLDGAQLKLTIASGGSLMAVGISIGDFDLPPAHASSKPRMAAGAKGALEHALRIALARGDKRIGSGHILLALLRAEAGTVPRALREAGVDRTRLNDRVAAATLA